MSLRKDLAGNVTGETLDDGSYIENGVVHNADGSVVDPATITPDNAQNAAGAAALHSGTIPNGQGGFVTYGTGQPIPNNAASFPYPHYDNGATAAPVIRSATSAENNAASNANAGNDGVGLPGIGGGGLTSGLLNPVSNLEALGSAVGSVDLSGLGRALGLSQGQAVSGLLGQQNASTALNGQLAAAANNALANPTAAPQIGSTALTSVANVPGVEDVRSVDVGKAALTNAAQATAAPQVVAGQVGTIPGVTAGMVAAPDAVGSGGPVAAGQAVASQLDPTQQAQFRANQQTLFGQLQGAITGQQPSVAVEQLKAQAQANEANQLGLAAANSRGGNAALARMTAANNIGRLNQQLSSAQALTRAQEIATAEGQAGNVADQGRASDIAIAGQNANLATGVSQGNAGLTTSANLATAANQLEANKATAANTLSAGTTNANLATSASAANAGNALSAGQTNAQLASAASAANAGNVVTQNDLNAQLTSAANSQNASAANALTGQQATINAGAASQDASAANASSAAYFAAQNAANNTNAAAQNTTNTQNATLTQNQGQINNQNVQGLAGAANNAGNTSVAAGSAVNTADKNQADAAQGTIKAIGSATSLLSDRRLKKDVAPGDADAEAFMRHISAKSYAYKDPALGAGRKTGVMAQDLEKTAAGKGMVRETTAGKMIDVGQGFGTFLASLANLHRRVSVMEGHRG